MAMGLGPSAGGGQLASASDLSYLDPGMAHSQPAYLPSIAKVCGGAGEPAFCASMFAFSTSRAGEDMLVGVVN